MGGRGGRIAEDRHGVRTRPARPEHRHGDGLKPDLIIAAGHSLVEPLDLVTANHLDQQFLFLGGRLGEPTVNVTAATFAPQQAAPAVRAGVAAVLTGWTGIVVDLG